MHTKLSLKSSFGEKTSQITICSMITLETGNISGKFKFQSQGLIRCYWLISWYVETRLKSVQSKTASHGDDEVKTKHMSHNQSQLFLQIMYVNKAIISNKSTSHSAQSLASLLSNKSIYLKLSNQTTQIYLTLQKISTKNNNIKSVINNIIVSRNKKNIQLIKQD